MMTDNNTEPEIKTVEAEKKKQPTRKRPKKPKTPCKCGGYYTDNKKRHEQSQRHRDFIEGEE
jgi:hypothetical protein